MVLLGDAGLPPALYDALGHRTGTLGRTGAGPGEYRAAYLGATLPADSLLIVDRGNRRAIVLAPDHREARTLPAPASTSAVLSLPGGSLLINAAFRDPNRVGLPLHLLDPAGRVVRSFGTEHPLVRPGELTRGVRRIARASAGGVWSARYAHRYEIQLWTLNGTLVRELTRRVAWFEEYDRYWSSSPERPAAPLILGVWEDAGGMLWVYTRVGDRNWRRGLGRERLVEGQRSYEIDNPDLLFDTMVEVIDPTRGELVASFRRDDLWGLVIAPGLLGQVRENDDGAYRIEVQRISLTKTP